MAKWLLTYQSPTDAGPCPCEMSTTCQSLIRRNEEDQQVALRRTGRNVLHIADYPRSARRSFDLLAYLLETLNTCQFSFGEMKKTSKSPCGEPAATCSTSPTTHEALGAPSIFWPTC